MLIELCNARDDELFREKSFISFHAKELLSLRGSDFQRVNGDGPDPGPASLRVITEALMRG